MNVCGCHLCNCLRQLYFVQTGKMRANRLKQFGRLLKGELITGENKK